MQMGRRSLGFSTITVLRGIYTGKRHRLGRWRSINFFWRTARGGFKPGKAISPLKRATVLLTLMLVAFPQHLWASKIFMSDGRILEGRLGMVAQVAENPLTRGKKGAGPV